MALLNGTGMQEQDDSVGERLCEWSKAIEPPVHRDHCKRNEIKKQTEDRGPSSIIRFVFGLGLSWPPLGPLVKGGCQRS